MVVGAEAVRTHTYWVVPVRVANPSEVIAALHRPGLMPVRSSLVIVPPADNIYSERPHAEWLRQTVFIPNGHAIGRCRVAADGERAGLRGGCALPETPARLRRCRCKAALSCACSLVHRRQ